MGVRNSWNAAVSTTLSASSRETQLPKICSAPSLSPAPRRMPARGAPPMPAKAAKADTIISTGKVTPTPVRAVAPMSGMLPMYIRSTTL